MTQISQAYLILVSIITQEPLVLEIWPSISHTPGPLSAVHDFHEDSLSFPTKLVPAELFPVTRSDGWLVPAGLQLSYHGTCASRIATRYRSQQARRYSPGTARPYSHPASCAPVVRDVHIVSAISSWVPDFA